MQGKWSITANRTGDRESDAGAAPWAIIVSPNTRSVELRERGPSKSVGAGSVLVASILLITLALSRQPWACASRIFLAAFVILFGARIAADRAFDNAAPAWACILAGFASSVGLVASMRRLAGIAALRSLLARAAVITGLALLASVRAPAAAEVVPPPDWNLVFEDEFKSLRLWDERSGGVWEPYYPWGARTNGGNTEIQYYIDPRPGRDERWVAGLAPFVFDKDGVIIVARRVPRPLQKFTGNWAYASGMLTTYRSFSFTFGYVEMRARMPKGKGFWPAFWLAPADQGWPPEIDILEVLGQNTKEFHATVHTNATGKPTEVSNRIETPDLADEFHVYAVKWTADDVTWYFDGRRVASTPTPADMHKPMYILVNLAVGGWAGDPDATTTFPAQYRIDRIKVFQAPRRDPATP